MYHVNAHHRVISAEEIFNNQVLGWPILWLPVSLFPQRLFSLSNELMNKVTMLSGMEVRHGLSNMSFYSPRLIWLRPWLTTQSANSRNQHWVSDMALFPEVISLVEDWLHWSISTMEGVALWSYSNRYLPWIQICPLCMQCFCYNYHPWQFTIQNESSTVLVFVLVSLGCHNKI